MWLRQHDPIRHRGLFGSVACGEAGPESGIDILVEVDPMGRRGDLLQSRNEVRLGA
jgi:predicted nucleotidyltransferase